MRTKELYASVAKRVDTEGTKINVAETSRVVSEMFGEIADRIQRMEICELDAVTWFAKELDKKLTEQSAVQRRKNIREASEKLEKRLD